jgi:hypothetical protein
LSFLIYNHFNSNSVHEHDPQNDSPDGRFRSHVDIEDLAEKIAQREGELMHGDPNFRHEKSDKQEKVHNENIEMDEPSTEYLHNQLHDGDDARHDHNKNNENSEPLNDPSIEYLHNQLHDGEDAHHDHDEKVDDSELSNDPSIEYLHNQLHGGSDAHHDHDKEESADEDSRHDKMPINLNNPSYQYLHNLMHDGDADGDHLYNSKVNFKPADQDDFSKWLKSQEESGDNKLERFKRLKDELDKFENKKTLRDTSNSNNNNDDDENKKDPSKKLANTIKMIEKEEEKKKKRKFEL